MTEATNARIAAMFKDIGNLLEIKGESPFIVNSYRQAAQMIGGLSHDLGEAARSGDDLTELPGIGRALADKIARFAETGSLGYYDDLLGEFPEGLVELTRGPGLGAKTVKRLWKELEVTSLDALEAAGRDGRLASLPRMGPRRAERILEGVDEARRGSA